MQRAPLLMLALASAVLTGCSTMAKSPRRQVSSNPLRIYNGLSRGPTYVFNSPNQDTIEDRTKDLESRGVSHDRAVSRATREANRQVWTSDSTEDAKSERARLAFQQQQDELNAGLRKLLADRAAR